jgi:hypothetical protein
MKNFMKLFVAMCVYTISLAILTNFPVPERVPDFYMSNFI